MSVPSDYSRHRIRRDGSRGRRDERGENGFPRGSKGTTAAAVGLMGPRFILPESCASYTHALALALGRYSSPGRLPFSGCHPRRLLGRGASPPPSPLLRRSRPPRGGHVGRRSASCAGANPAKGERAHQMAGIIHPLTGVNDLRAESRLGVA